MLEQDGFLPIVRFIACSDTHFADDADEHDDLFANAMRQSFELAGAPGLAYAGIDAVCVCGDTVSEGTEAQYRHFKSAVDSCIPRGTRAILMYGGHECGVYGEDAAAERFRRIYGGEPDSDTVINGFHFIALSTRVNNSRDSYPKEKVEWLGERLKNARAERAKWPIFVFHHPNLKNTVYGSRDWANPGLESTLVDYPEAIDFSGHSHFPINDPRSIHQRYLTTLNTGSFDNFDCEKAEKPFPIELWNETRGNYAAQYYFVEADALGRVRIYPYDSLSRTFYPYVWRIDQAWEPETYLYTDAVRRREAVPPKLAPDAGLALARTPDGKLRVSFTRAPDADVTTLEYLFTFRKISDGAVVRRFSDWSGYHIRPMPERYERDIPGLDDAEPYSLEIRAVGFWDNTSEEALRAEFTIGELPIKA